MQKIHVFSPKNDPEMFRVDYFFCMFSRIFREFLCFVSERILKKHLKQTLQKIQHKTKNCSPEGCRSFRSEKLGILETHFRYFFNSANHQNDPEKKLKFGTLFGSEKKDETKPENVSPKSSFFLI